MTFSSELDARQFLVNKITAAADAQGIVLSDGELRLLLLNLEMPASAGGIPVEVLEDKSRTYEKKMTALLRSAYKRDLDNAHERQQYKDALRELRDTDEYMLIIATAAIPHRKRFANVAVYVLIALAVAAMIVVLQMWTRAK